MIRYGQAGISCADCGHKEIVNTARMRDHLIEILTWHECGDPVCPACGELLTFEDYLPDTDSNAPALQALASTPEQSLSSIRRAERERCAEVCKKEATEAFLEGAEDWGRSAVMCAVAIQQMED